MAEAQQHPVVLFDGVCSLCSSAVQWIIRHDPNGVFRFASLQSVRGSDVQSIVLLDRGGMYFRSTAFLHILRRLPRLRWLAFVGAVIPQPIRDLVYDYIAGRRYGWFGKMDQCMLPTPQIAERFIDRPAAVRE